jgi:hypothetical protein
MQLGLAIQLYHLCSSKNLLNILREHRFCADYKEVIKFERCAAITTNKDLFIPPRSLQCVE